MKNHVASAFLKGLPLALLLLAHPAKAQTTVFLQNLESALWSGANWSTGSAPGSADIAGINGNSPSPSRVDIDFHLGTVAFSGSSARSIFIDSGVALRLYGTGQSTLINQGASANMTINGDGELRLAASGVFHVDGATRSLTIGAKVTDTGSPGSGITKTGPGTLSFITNSANSTFSGGVHLKEGIVAANVTSAGTANAPTSGPFGTGVLTLEGGEFRYTGSATTTVYHNAIAITGDFQFGSSTTVYKGFRLTGNINLNNATRAVTFHQDVTVDGVISNGALTKRGPDTLTLTAAQAYTGATNIESGALRLTSNGSLASSTEIAVHSGATLAIDNSYRFASGQILSGTGRLTGTFRPGATTVIEAGGEGVIGTLSLEGNTLLDGGDFRFELSSGGHDQLRLAGDGLSLTGNTTGAVTISLIDLDGSALPGDYLLISTSALVDATLTDWTLASFTLADLPTGWEGELWLDANGLSFRAIPEPQTFLLVLGGVALLFARRRAKR